MGCTSSMGKPAARPLKKDNEQLNDFQPISMNPPVALGRTNSIELEKTEQMKTENNSKTMPQQVNKQYDYELTGTEDVDALAEEAAALEELQRLEEERNNFEREEA